MGVEQEELERRICPLVAVTLAAGFALGELDNGEPAVMHNAWHVPFYRRE